MAENNCNVNVICKRNTYALYSIGYVHSAIFLCNAKNNNGREPAEKVSSPMRTIGTV